MEIQQGERSANKKTVKMQAWVSLLMQIYSFTKEPRKSEGQSKIKSREKVIKKKANGLQRIFGASAVARLAAMAAVLSSRPLVVAATSPQEVRSPPPTPTLLARRQQRLSLPLHLLHLGLLARMGSLPQRRYHVE